MNCESCDGKVTDHAQENYILLGAQGLLVRTYCENGHRIENWVPQEDSPVSNHQPLPDTETPEQTYERENPYIAPEPEPEPEPEPDPVPPPSWWKSFTGGKA